MNNQLTALFNHAVRFYGLPKSPCFKTEKMRSNKSEMAQALDEGWRNA